MWKIRWLALATLALFLGCTRPIDDPSTLEAIQTEAQMLINNMPMKASESLPRSKWPQVIASLNPESVTVHTDGVDVLIKPNFDGGWGYFIPINEEKILEPKGRFTTIGQGVYWYHPY